MIILTFRMIRKALKTKTCFLIVSRLGLLVLGNAYVYEVPPQEQSGQARGETLDVRC